MNFLPKRKEKFELLSSFLFFFFFCLFLVDKIKLPPLSLAQIRFVSIIFFTFYLFIYLPIHKLFGFIFICFILFYFLFVSFSLGIREPREYILSRNLLRIVHFSKVSNALLIMGVGSNIRTIFFWKLWLWFVGLFHNHTSAVLVYKYDCVVSLLLLQFYFFATSRGKISLCFSSFFFFPSWKYFN